MTVRVLVDVTAIPQDRGGVGRYLDGVLPALGQLDVDLVLVAQAHDVAGFRTSVPTAQVVSAPALVARRPVRLLWEQTLLPLLARRCGADVVHSPHYTLPLLAGRPVVVTVHDATFFTDPGLHTPTKGRFFRTATRLAGRLAAALVAPSRATRAEVVREAGVDPGKVHVAWHGVDTSVFRPPAPGDRSRVPASLGLTGRYIAFLGTIEPRKNVPALIAGWVQAVRDLDDPPALVLAGGAGWDDRVDAAVAAVPGHLTLLRPGYLPLADLPGLLGGAEVVAYPSLGEGFGLPVLEAMACGATVLTTERLALPEVGGDAVAYCEVDSDSIGRALADLLADPARRSALADRARGRAATFTWERAAQVHLEVYRQAAGSGPWWRRWPGRPAPHAGAGGRPV
ncbi:MULTISPECIES: glycosyltransferase family 4 protein [unclassified Modestobacter]|uniref:glycosyltransferase family 4 protein n=1 Tax=unclassified Modestobacter TaxID=2643866 RepID=UPI0022AA79BC|nr:MULTISPECIES: glycosyltransferase family 1 protein [unclassified Modestobacter]MCZ2823788.1 glycosyltransferase family 1 protein [Modestobacter sp. VKM Ac-2981]MCZ2852033.1 glycosyltransferase family 1 protein [Modestobacter sp. VKM Ac-2982]